MKKNSGNRNGVCRYAGALLVLLHEENRPSQKNHPVPKLPNDGIGLDWYLQSSKWAEFLFSQEDVGCQRIATHFDDALYNYLVSAKDAVL